jgi:hypothetical protein
VFKTSKVRRNIEISRFEVIYRSDCKICVQSKEDSRVVSIFKDRHFETG